MYYEISLFLGFKTENYKICLFNSRAKKTTAFGSKALKKTQKADFYFNMVLALIKCVFRWL